jgi:hypothetical protein
VLDFVIVVVGVDVALMGQQWLSDDQRSADLRVAEVALQKDLLVKYMWAKELAVAGYRVEAYQAIATQLPSPGEDWIGMPRPSSDNDKIFNNAKPILLRSPSLNWGSRNWQAGLARGTFNHMDDQRHTRSMNFSCRHNTPRNCKMTYIPCRGG